LGDPAERAVEGEAHARSGGTEGGIDGHERQVESVALRRGEAFAAFELDDQGQDGRPFEGQPDDAKSADLKQAGQRLGRTGDAAFEFDLIVGDQREAVVEETKQKIGFPNAGRAEK